MLNRMFILCFTTILLCQSSMYLYCDCHLFNIMSIKIVKRLELFQVKFSLLFIIIVQANSMPTRYSLYSRSVCKSCALDPIPTSLLLECLDTVLPVLTNIVNTSLTSGIYPSIYKMAIVKPLPKFFVLDPNDLKKLQTSLQSFIYVGSA